MHEYCQLACDSIKTYLETGEIMPVPFEIADELRNKQAGAFVSLHVRSDHSLRGCIGTFLPTQENLALEIINNAISAATQDPRFGPVRLAELADLEINVDVLSEPAVCEKKDLDPRKYGVIVSCGMRRGLLLPDLEGVDTVAQQLGIACQKAGIDYDSEDFSVERFTVERYK